MNKFLFITGFLFLISNILIADELNLPEEIEGIEIIQSNQEELESFGFKFEKNNISVCLTEPDEDSKMVRMYDLIINSAFINKINPKEMIESKLQPVMIINQFSNGISHYFNSVQYVFYTLNNELNKEDLICYQIEYKFKYQTNPNLISFYFLKSDVDKFFEKQDEEVKVVEKTDLFTNVSIYPIPVTKGELTLEFDLSKDQKLNIGVYEASGSLRKVIYSSKSFSKGKNEITFSSDEFSSGIYLLRISDEKENTIIKKFIVSR